MEESLAEQTPVAEPLPIESQPDDDAYLLISDVDDTLLGDEAGLEQFHHWFYSLEGALEVTYASGRFVQSIAASVATTHLPVPVAAIGGVGSDIRDLQTGKFIPGWRERMSNQWDAQQVVRTLLDEDDLELQPEEFQSDFKVSYFLHEALPAHLEKLNSKLRQHGIEADYIYSSQRDLDFLPAGVNKGSAASFYANYRNYPANRVFVSGNSGNDASLFQYGFRGIIVGNAHAELKALANDTNYLAERGHAAGVMEGIQHWMRQDLGGRA